MEKAYLGDSVYAEFDGFHVVLTTENGHRDDPSNRIAIEPSVFNELKRYVDRLDEIKGLHKLQTAGAVAAKAEDHFGDTLSGYWIPGDGDGRGYGTFLGETVESAIQALEG